MNLDDLQKEAEALLITLFNFMKTDLTEIEINGKSYVLKGSQKEAAVDLDGMKYVIVRTYAAGVFAGYLENIKTESGIRIANVKQARRLWYWSGASSLSQLAMEGVKNPKDCKFPCEVTSIELSNVVEVIDCTKAAQESINSVPVWKQT